MRTTVYAYIGGILVLALFVVAAMPWEPVLALSARDYLGILAFAILGILSECKPVSLSIPNSKNQTISSVVFLPLLASALIFPPIIVITIAVTVQLFGELILLPRVLWRTIFNVSQLVLAYGTAALVYVGLRGLSPFGGDIDPIAFFLMAATFFLINQAAIGFFISIREQRRVRDVLYTTLFKGATNIAYNLLASPIAIFTFILYRDMYIGGLVLILLPFYLVRYSSLTAQRLHQANADLLTVFVKTIETRDPYTSGHSLRVSTLARVIAEDMNLPQRQVEQIEQAALLHDVGKIDPIYTDIIAKPFQLTKEERETIQTHAARGAELLSSLTSLPQQIIQAVRHHHERYDGAGYPDGLKGSDIPLAARVIMLCDSIDAMLSDRPYRNALSIRQVHAELVRCSGTQFDPAIVRVVITRDTLFRASTLVKLAEASMPKTFVSSEVLAHS
jgi:putative nucleotidyltransferase with HDIG domain